ncbi:MAG TPA: LuxR C-terminal-related transcriptional regulator [bacterium]|nr:LuxR C-terminal-related transcriptional regulator [bacterium]
MDHVEDAVGADLCGLYHFDPVSLRALDIHVRHISDSFVFEYEKLKPAEPGYQQLIRTREAVSDSSVYPGDQWRRSPCAPMLQGTKIIGMICIGRKSYGSYFDRGTESRLKEVSRVLSERLVSFSNRDETEPNDGEHSSGKFARQRAERVFLRSHLHHLMAGAFPLGFQETASLWNSLAANRSLPVDFFDLDGYRYVLMRPEEPVSSRKRPSRLTQGEAEVVRRAALGEANKAIGYDLGMSINTVASRLASAMSKLGVHSRVLLHDEEVFLDEDEILGPR